MKPDHAVERYGVVLRPREKHGRQVRRDGRQRAERATIDQGSEVRTRRGVVNNIVRRISPPELSGRRSASRKASQHGRYGKCCKKRRNSGDDRPGDKCDERRVLAVCCGEQSMNVRGEREAESPERDRPGRMQRRGTGRTAQSIVLVPNLRRGHGGAGHPRCQPPQAHMIGVSRLGERTETDAGDHIRHGNKNHRTDPRAA